MRSGDDLPFLCFRNDQTAVRLSIAPNNRVTHTVKSRHSPILDRQLNTRKHERDDTSQSSVDTLLEGYATFWRVNRKSKSSGEKKGQYLSNMSVDISTGGNRTRHNAWQPIEHSGVVQRLEAEGYLALYYDHGAERELSYVLSHSLSN